MKTMYVNGVQVTANFDAPLPWVKVHGATYAVGSLALALVLKAICHGSR